MNKKFVFTLIGVLLVIAVIFSVTMKAKDTITIEMSERVQEFSGEKMSESLLNNLEIEDPELLHFVTHWGGTMRFYLSSDSKIENFIWEMAIKNKKGIYDIYQAGKGAGNNLNVSKIDKVTEKDDRNGTILDALVTIEQLPWDSVFAVLPKGDKYGVRINDIYDKGEKIVLNTNKKSREDSDEFQNLGNDFSYPIDFYLLKNGKLEKVNDEILDLDQTTYAVTFSVLYKRDDDFVGQVEAIVLVPLKQFKQHQ
ncbi:hypothetical protein [Aquibacillus sediminis]|uniref:hypothetical protein n=1 Tax=Aquibacillus sediminis TaxID=2574734 RepID=UPI001108ED4A|nr:hypothetical protein [Aquibacillus sediminis]